MSRETDVLRSLYEAYNRRDVDGFVDKFWPDAKFRPFTGSLIEDRPYVGHEELRRWLTETLPETWEDMQATPLEFLGGGTLFVVIVSNVGVGRTSGVEVEQQVAHLVRMREGRIASLTVYTDRAQALRDAGLVR